MDKPQILDVIHKYNAPIEKLMIGTEPFPAFYHPTASTICLVVPNFGREG
jgi:hypothetical protein